MADGQLNIRIVDDSPKQAAAAQSSPAPPARSTQPVAGRSAENQAFSSPLPSEAPSDDYHRRSPRLQKEAPQWKKDEQRDREKWRAVEKLRQEFEDPEEKFDRLMNPVKEMFESGIIGENLFKQKEEKVRSQVYAPTKEEKAEAAVSKREAAKEERKEEKAIQAADRLTETPQDKFDRLITPLEELLDKGKITQEKFDAAKSKLVEGLEDTSEATGVSMKAFSSLADALGLGGVLGTFKKFNAIASSAIEVGTGVFKAMGGLAKGSAMNPIASTAVEAGTTAAGTGISKVATKAAGTAVGETAGKVATEAAGTAAGGAAGKAAAGALGGAAGPGAAGVGARALALLASPAGAAAAGLAVVATGAAVAGSELGPFAGAVGAAVPVLGIFVGGMKKLIDSVTSDVNELGNYNAQAAVASARSELRNEMRMIGKANTLGPDTARLEELRSRLDDEVAKQWTQIRLILTKILLKFEPQIEKAISLLEAGTEIASDIAEKGDFFFEWFPVAVMSILKLIPGVKELGIIADIALWFRDKQNEEDADLSLWADQLMNHPDFGFHSRNRDRRRAVRAAAEGRVGTLGGA